MIQAKELRIRNWIAIPESGIQAVVKTIDEKRFAIHIDNIDLSPGENVFEYSSAEPIQLTPEILKKCGFEKTDDVFHLLKIKGMGVIQWGDDGSIGVGDSDDKFLFASNKNVCKYLHQLQNLYFALTGEELTYNP